MYNKYHMHKERERESNEPRSQDISIYHSRRNKQQNQSVMPSRSSSRRKAKKQDRKFKTLTTPNSRSSPTVQFQGKPDLKSFKEENGSGRNGSLRHISERFASVVVEERKGEKRECSLSAGVVVSESHNKMEEARDVTLEETQKLECQHADKEVIAEEVKSIVDLGGEVAADDKSRSVSETQDGDGSTAGNITDEEAKNDEENRQLVDSGKVEDAGGVPVENIQITDDVEHESKEKQEKDLLFPEHTDEGVKGHEDTELPPSEESNELASAVADEGLRETEAIEDFTGTEVDKVTSSEEKNVLSSVVTDEVLRESVGTNLLPPEENIGSSLPPTDVVSKATEETIFTKSGESDKVHPATTEAVLKGVEDSRLPATDEKVGEQSVVLDSSKEKAEESLQPLPNLPAPETTSAPLQHKTEIPKSTETPTTVRVTQRQHTFWSSCCGLCDILNRDYR